MEACNFQIIGETGETKAKKRGRLAAPSRLKVELEGQQNRKARTEGVNKALAKEGRGSMRFLEVDVL